MVVELIQEPRFLWQESRIPAVITVSSPDHRLQDGRAELFGGELVPCYEKPERAEIVLARVRDAALGDVVPPNEFCRSPLRVHDVRFLDVLETAWERWVEAHGEKDALPMSWAVRTFRQKEPRAIDGKLGYYCLDAATPITRGTWKAATSAANTALTAAALVAEGERAAFALARPPGHHASRDLYGGYCFLNNAAIAAQSLLDGGAARVAILDVDYHHGNGTQSIFYARGDVLFVSIHGDPADEFPYFLGYADETGRGRGGMNVSFTLPGDGSGVSSKPSTSAKKISAVAPDALVVSPRARHLRRPYLAFPPRGDDYLRDRKRVTARPPDGVRSRGSYTVAALGVNAVNVLSGFRKADWRRRRWDSLPSRLLEG
jgi:acetoin utilization deacetylase AcuC-like enzyme